MGGTTGARSYALSQLDMTRLGFMNMLRAALSAVRGVVQRLDSLAACALCREIVPADQCKVNCTCASEKVAKRNGYRCGPVLYCPKCHDSLRTDAGDPIPEMSRELWTNG